MYLNFTVDIPDKKTGISKKTIRGTTYIYYEHGRKYYADRKYTVPQCTSIGKVSEEKPGQMTPNGNYLKFFPDALLPEELPVSQRSACLKIGGYLVIRRIINHYGLEERIGKILPKNTGLFLDLAAYAIIAENNAAQYYPDYAYDHPLFTEDMRIYSDATVSRFLKSIHRDDAVTFQNEWNVERDHREKIYISYDSTNKHCQAGEVELAEFGHEKDVQKKKIYNFSVAYDMHNRTPLFYEEYPGSINDNSQLSYMLEKAEAYGYKNAGFILDRGYFSEPNIRFMDKKGYDFIIMVKGCKTLVNSLVKQVRGTFEDEWKNHIPYYDVNGITVKSGLFPGDEKERYFHIYYSDYRKSKEKAKLQTEIQEQKEFLESLKGKNETIGSKYWRYFDLIYYHEGKKDQQLQIVRENDEAISDDMKLCGYFVIITSSQMTAEAALELYKSRDASEKLFRGDKTYLGGRSERVYETEPMRSKIFIEFVALIIRNKLYTCLTDRMKETHKKKNYMTVPAALKELDKIEMVRYADGKYHMDHAVTATQKDILKAFNITANDVVKAATEISNRIDQAEKM